MCQDPLSSQQVLISALLAQCEPLLTCDIACCNATNQLVPPYDNLTYHPVYISIYKTGKYYLWHQQYNRPQWQGGHRNGGIRMEEGNGGTTKGEPD